MHIRTTAISLLALSGALSAQTVTQKVLPLNAEVYDGNSASAFPFAYQSQRMQEIFSGASICNAQAMIQGIKMRINLDDAQTSGPFTTQMTVTLSHTTVSPQNISTAFANNITGQTTQVFNGNLSLPSQTMVPAGSKAAPFNLAICAPQTPFFYLQSSGDLLMDITTGLPQGKSSYFVDAASSGGGQNTFGDSGLLGSMETLDLRPDGKASQAIPGGSMKFMTSLKTTSFPGELLIGVDDTMMFGLPLPFDMGNFGAPGNQFYIASVVAVPHNFGWVAPYGYQSPVTLPIPNQPALVGGRIFAQPYVIDAKANAAGVVMGNAAVVRIGDTSPLSMSQVGSADAFSATGGLFYGQSGLGGAVVEFTGVFN